MIDMHSKYDNMHTNGIFNALISINNHVNLCINYMLCITMTSPSFSMIRLNGVCDVMVNNMTS